jgi:hypothetical protein
METGFTKSDIVQSELALGEVSWYRILVDDFLDDEDCSAQSEQFQEIKRLHAGQSRAQFEIQG